jgi:hypothetical protein
MLARMRRCIRARPAGALELSRIYPADYIEHRLLPYKSGLPAALQCPDAHASGHNARFTSRLRLFYISVHQFNNGFS